MKYHLIENENWKIYVSTSWFQTILYLWHKMWNDQVCRIEIRTKTDVKIHSNATN